LTAKCLVASFFGVDLDFNTRVFSDLPYTGTFGVLVIFLWLANVLATTSLTELDGFLIDSFLMGIYL
jgi:hypothetical protein